MKKPAKNNGIDDFEFDSDSDGSDGPNDALAKRPVHDLAHIIADTAAAEFPWTSEHVLLCRLISLYGSCAQRPSDEEMWIRSTPLAVLTYECISAGVLDFDYAPVLTDVSHGGSSKKVWLNISQEAQTAIDELRMYGLVRVVRMYTVDYKPTTAYQVSEAGLKMMKVVPPALFDELKHVVYVPDKENTFSDKVQISWDPEKNIFSLRSEKSGYHRYSTITEIEDVSYVSSPYIPEFLRRGTEPTTDNRPRAMEAFAGMTNIKDADLMEAISLGDVKMLLCEWVPFGENSIVSMAMNLGALDRCQSGMFSAKVDKNPANTSLKIPAGLTSVKIMDFDMLQHINVEAEINYPEDDGIIQVEFFGIHVSTRGSILFGLSVDSIMTRQHGAVSIDLLTRMAVDVLQDSSTILDDMINGHQRELLDALYQGNSESRKKFCVYLAKSIDPFFPSAAQYLDRGDHENELAQIIGQIRFSSNLGDKHFLFMGNHGLLVTGARSHEYDSFVVPFSNLQAMMLVAGAVYERFNHIFEMLDEAMDLADDTESTPFNVARVQFLMSTSSQEINILNLIVKHLADAVDRALMPPEPRDEVGIRLFRALRCRQWQTSVRERTRALQSLMVDAQRKVAYLRRHADLVNKNGLHKTVSGAGTQFMVLFQRSFLNFRKVRNLWIVQTLFGMLFVLRFVTKYRFGIGYCDVKPMTRTLEERISEFDLIWNYFEPPGGIYSEECEWINPIQLWLQDNPFISLAMALGLVAIMVAFGDKGSWLWMKRTRKAFGRAMRSWLPRAGQEVARPHIVLRICSVMSGIDIRCYYQVMGRTTHRVIVQGPVDSFALERYASDKTMIKSRVLREHQYGEQQPSSPYTSTLLQWKESDRSVWKGTPPVISAVYDQEIGYLHSVRFDVEERGSGLHVGKLWATLQGQWAKKGVVDAPKKARVNTGRLMREDTVTSFRSGEDTGVRSEKGKEKGKGKEGKSGAVPGRKGLGRRAAAEWREERRRRRREGESARAEWQRESKAARQRVMAKLYEEQDHPLFAAVKGLAGKKKQEEDGKKKAGGGEEEEEAEGEEEEEKEIAVDVAPAKKGFEAMGEESGSEAASEGGGEEEGRGESTMQKSGSREDILFS